MKIFLLVFCALFFLSGSCKKGTDSGTTTAEGQIIDKTTSAGIPNARAMLMRRKSDSWSAIDRTVIEEKRTDNAGHFHFEFEAAKGYNYEIAGSALHYIDDNQTGILTIGDKNENVKIRLQPWGYLMIKLINEPPAESSDVYIFGSFNPTIALPKFTKDTIFIRAVLGNQENEIVLETHTSGGQSFQNYKVYTPVLDTTEIILRY